MSRAVRLEFPRFYADQTSKEWSQESEGDIVEAENRPAAGVYGVPGEARRCPRFKFETNIRVYSNKTGLLRGHTSDISESGISAILTLEVGVGDLVELEFDLPSGPVAIRALVCHKTAFRYGFHFVEPDPEGAIKAVCSSLACEHGGHPELA